MVDPANESARARAKKLTRDDYLAFFAARGITARDLRDGAHEASHGIDVDPNLLMEWDRESLHAAIMEMEPVDRFKTEVRARALEHVACALLGEPYDGKAFTLVACMEMHKAGVEVDPDTFKNAVTWAIFTGDGRRQLRRMAMLAREWRDLRSKHPKLVDEVGG